MGLETAPGSKPLLHIGRVTPGSFCRSHTENLFAIESSDGYRALGSELVLFREVEMTAPFQIPSPSQLVMPEVAVAGVGYRLLISAQETGGAYELMYFVVPPGHGAPMHVHQNEDECAYTIDGEIQGFVGDRVVHTPAGTAIHLPRGVPHGFRNTGTKQARFLMWVTPGRLEGFYESCQSPWDCTCETSPKLTDQEMVGMAQIAAQYGIQILPA